MNLMSIWSGTDYAYYEWKGRNDHFRPGAPRVKAIRAFKEKEYGRTRETGFVEVMLLNEDGTPKENYKGEHVIKKVRARDIAMLWDEYVEERDYRAAQAEKIAVERATREAKENQLKTQISELLTEKYGIPQEAISSVKDGLVYLNRHVLERELGLVSAE